MAENYLLKMLQQQGYAADPDQQNAPEPQQTLESVQPPPEPAPAYPAGKDLSGIDLSTNEPYRVTKPPQSRIKSMLMGFMHGMGESMRIYAGMGSDSENEYRRAQTANYNAETEFRRTQTEQMGDSVMLPIPGVGIMPVPKKDAAGILKAIATGEYGLGRTAMSSRFKTTPIGLFDTQAGSMVPGSGPEGVTVTPEIAGNNPALQQFIGKKVKWSDYNGATRAEAISSGFTMGADGPVAANKITGVGNPVTVNGKPVGNPGVAVANVRALANAKYGIAITDEGDTVSKLEALTKGLRLASGNPLLTKGLKPYEDAYAADARLKQMEMQSQDQTGASDMALLFNHMAMTGGNVKGMRMGELMTHEHMRARSIPEELGVLYNKAVAGEKLSPEQRVNFLRLAREVRQTTWQRAAQEGKVYGVDPAFAEQDPELDPIDLSAYKPKVRLTPKGKTASGGSDWFHQHGGVKR
jgi:uncharacterized membrane protein